MAYNPLGVLLGDCPYGAADESPPNRSTPATLQPPGTKFIAEGEGLTARIINRALAGLAGGVDGIRGGASGSADTVYRRDGIVGDTTTTRFQLNGWVFIGDLTLPWTTGLPEEYASVIQDTTGAQYFDAAGNMAKITRFEDPAASPGPSINDGTERPHTTAQAITATTGNRVTVAADLVTTDDVITGLHAEISGSTGTDHDGMYQIDVVNERASTDMDLSNFRHRLRISGASLGWAIGDQVQDPGANVTGYVQWVDSASPTTIIEVRLTSAKDFTGIATVDNLTQPDSATINSYESPDTPVLLDPLKVTGIATVQVYTDGLMFHSPVAFIRTGATPLPAGNFTVAFKGPRRSWDSDEGQRFADISTAVREALEQHLLSHPGPASLGPIKITPDDTNARYVQNDVTLDKFVAGTNVTLTVLGAPFTDQQLRISASGGGASAITFTATNKSGSLMSKGTAVAMKGTGPLEIDRTAAAAGETVGVVLDDVADNASEDVQTTGVADVLLPLGLTGGATPADGQGLWLHPTQSGRLINEPPTDSDPLNPSKRVGTIIDASAYVGSANANSLVTAVWAPEMFLDNP